MVQKYPNEREEKVLELVKSYPLYSLDKLASNLEGVSRHSIQNILEKNNLSTIEKRLEFSLEKGMMGNNGELKEEKGEITERGNEGIVNEMKENKEEPKALEVKKDKLAKRMVGGLSLITHKALMLVKIKAPANQDFRSLATILIIGTLILIGSNFAFSKAPIITLEKPALEEEVQGGKLIVSGKVLPSSSQLIVNGEKVLVGGDGGFTTIVEIPQGESILSVEATSKFRKAKTVRLVNRVLTEEETKTQQQAEAAEKKEKVNEVAQIDRQVNDLLAAKNAATNNIAGGIVKVTNSQLKQESGFTTVVGEVLNMGQKEVAWVMIVAKFLNASGGVIESKIGFATGFDETLKAGSTASFETQATTQTFDRYSLEVTWQEGEVAGAATNSALLTPTPSATLRTSPTPKATIAP